MTGSTSLAVEVEVEPVELLPAWLVWSILRRYAHSSPGAGSQWAGLGAGGGGGSTSARDMVATIGAKLARSPVVERVLWLDEAGDWIRNVWLPSLGRGGPAPDLHREPPPLVRAVIEARFEARRADSLARRSQRSRTFAMDWTLIVCELSACYHDERGGGPFRAWVHRWG